MVTCEGKIVHQHKVSQQCLVKYWHRKNAQTNRVGAVTLHTEHTWLHAGHESSKSSDKLSFYDELATCPGCTLPSPYDDWSLMALSCGSFVERSLLRWVSSPVCLPGGRVELLTGNK